MGTSKILIDGVGIDLTADTVTAAHLEQGYTAHDASGDSITGTLTPGITPSGTKSITANGTYDVTNYEMASVNTQLFKVYRDRQVRSTSGYTYTITHNLNTKKIIVFIQAIDGSTFTQTYYCVSGMWLSEDFLADYVDERSYNFSYSTGLPNPTVSIAEWVGHTMNCGSATADTLYHTPAGNVWNSGAQGNPVTSITNNEVTVQSRYQFKSSVTYDITVIGIA